MQNQSPFADMEGRIADHVRVCTEYAKRQGWRIVQKFEDQGISGTAMGNRPGVLSMRDAALAGRFDVLLVSDLSRIARSEDLPPVISRLSPAHVKENAVALSIALTPQELQTLDAAFPGPFGAS